MTLKLEMYQNSVPSGFKDSVPVPVLAEINSIPAGTEVIVANSVDLFRNISTFSLHGEIYVGDHLLKIELAKLYSHTSQ